MLEQQFQDFIQASLQKDVADTTNYINNVLSKKVNNFDEMFVEHPVDYLQVVNTMRTLSDGADEGFCIRGVD